VVNFYRHFVLDSLKGGLKATTTVEWTIEMEKTFTDAKAALCKTALLAHPRQGWELALMVDASSDCVGAVLQQRSSPRNSAFDWKLSACCPGIRYSRYMLEVRSFTIYTNHKPLTYALGKVADGWAILRK
jgi:hypothetical protein